MFYHVFTYLKALLKSEKGQGAVEYGLIIALVSIALVAAMLVISGSLDTVMQAVADAINGADVDALTE